jgi:hypothetical protein
VITDEGVTVGEDANTGRLSHLEWNELPRLLSAARSERGRFLHLVGCGPEPGQMHFL